MFDVSIKDLRDKKVKSKIWSVSVFVHKALTSDLFVVGDGETNVFLDISGHPEVGRELAPMRCFKIPKAVITNDVMTLGMTSRACPIAPFDVDPLSAEEEEFFVAPQPDLEGFVKLEDVGDVEADTTINAIYLKVFFVSSDRKSTHSPFRVVKVKDLNGAKHFIQLFGSHRLDVYSGGVFRFGSLIVQSYRREGERWGRMRSQRITRIEAASPEVTDLFEAIGAGDMSFSGVIMAHEKVHMYECCSKCARSKFRGNENNLCIFCGEEIPEEICCDWNVTFLIVKGDQIHRVGVFRSQLHLELNALTESQVEKRMQGLHDQHCRVWYDHDPNQELIRAEALVLDSSPLPETESLPDEELYNAEVRDEGLGQENAPEAPFEAESDDIEYMHE